jgi:hypothetical protein
MQESDLALLDATTLAVYVKNHLRKMISQSGSAAAASFTNAQIDFVALAFEFSALRLPAHMSIELLTEYAELPDRQRDRVSYNDYAASWEQGDSRPPLRVPDYEYKVHIGG